MFFLIPDITIINKISVDHTHLKILAKSRRTKYGFLDFIISITYCESLIITTKEFAWMWSFQRARDLRGGGADKEEGQSAWSEVDIDADIDIDMDIDIDTDLWGIKPSSFTEPQGTKYGCLKLTINFWGTQTQFIHGALRTNMDSWKLAKSLIYYKTNIRAAKEFVWVWSF